MATLQSVFNDVLSGETLTVLHNTKAEYESMRSALLRKFRRLKEDMEKLGYDTYAGKFIQCRYDSIEVSGTYTLAADTARTNTKREYKLKEL